MKAIAFAVLLATALPAKAEDAQLTVQQCIEVLTGLSSLSFRGQINPQQKPPDDSKPYKLGPLLATIGFNIHDLSPIDLEARKAQIAYTAELPPSMSEAAKAKALQDNWDKIINQPCRVHPDHIKIGDLRLGDAADQNPIPPNVLAVLAPILDGRDK